MSDYMIAEAGRTPPTREARLQLALPLLLTKAKQAAETTFCNQYQFLLQIKDGASANNASCLKSVVYRYGTVLPSQAGVNQFAPYAIPSVMRSTVLSYHDPLLGLPFATAFTNNLLTVKILSTPNAALTIVSA